MLIGIWKKVFLKCHRWPAIGRQNTQNMFFRRQHILKRVSSIKRQTPKPNYRKPFPTMAFHSYIT